VVRSWLGFESSVDIVGATDLIDHLAGTASVL
jgi:hypothetical protein